MSLLRVDSFSLSLDGYGAGPNQSLEHPLGVGGPAMHTWAFTTRTFHERVLHDDGGTAGTVDDGFAARSFENVGAWILGRNMFTPSRGAWTDDGWQGWWGDEPPYHVPVFVLTHHARAPLVMAGGTTFHFVTGGIHDALAQAREAAGARDVRVGGGVATVRQYVEARLVDRLHLAVSPALLGQGEHFWHGLDLPALGYALTQRVPTEYATHLMIERTDSDEPGTRAT
jgi:dihydrofolate reductase